MRYSSINVIVDIEGTISEMNAMYYEIFWYDKLIFVLFTGMCR